MNKIILLFKRIFGRHEARKQLASDEKNANHANQRNEFFDSLKVNELEENEETSKAEKNVLVCVGDGLGITQKFSA